MIMYSFMCYFLQIGTTSLLQSTEPKHSKNTTKKRRKKKKGNSAMGIYQSFFLKQNLSFVGFCCGKKQRQTDKQTNTTSRQTLKLTHHWAAPSHREYWCLCQQAPRSPWLARCPDWEYVLTSICTQSKGKAGEHLIMWLKWTVSKISAGNHATSQPLCLSIRQGWTTSMTK